MVDRSGLQHVYVCVSVYGVGRKAKFLFPTQKDQNSPPMASPPPSHPSPRALASINIFLTTKLFLQLDCCVTLNPYSLPNMATLHFTVTNLIDDVRLLASCCLDRTVVLFCAASLIKTMLLEEAMNSWLWLLS